MDTKQGQTLTKRTRRTHGVYAFVIVLVSMVLLFAGQGPMRAQLHAWKLLPQPERLTELYFTDHTALPATYVPGATQAVSFAAHNLEGQDTTYTYAVIAQDETGVVRLSGGTVLAPAGQTVKAKAAVVVPNLGERVRITITIVPTNQSISYWVKKAAS